MATLLHHGSMVKQSTSNVSDQLRRIIDDCGLSRYEISKRTGIDEAALSRFMSGERGLSMKALDKLGACLSLTVHMRRQSK
jgi:transcriptional regulator with XRE-family HTH domain